MTEDLNLAPVTELDFRGNKYKIHALQRTPQDPSWFSFYDEAIVRDRDWTIQKGDFIIDIGSGYGSYSLPAMASGAAQCFCINPNDDENNWLKKNFELNGWGSNLLICDHGLYSKSGWLDDLSQKFVEGMTDHVHPGGFQVESLDSFDHMKDWWESAPRIFMKLDVEGAELEVLHGAKNFLEANRDKLHILVENHVFKFPDIAEKVREYLTLLDFTHVRTEPYHGVSHSVYIGRSAYCQALYAKWDEQFPDYL